MKTFIVLGAILAGLTRLPAQETSVATADLAYASDYVFRGIEHADDSFQPSLELSHESAYLGVWMDQPIRNHQHDEMDLYAGYRYKLTRTLSVEAVGTYYDYPQAKGRLTRHTYEAGLGATYTFRGISASGYFYHDFELKSETEQASVGYSIPLERWGTSVDFNGFVGSVQAVNWRPNGPLLVKESYNYCGLDVTLPYKLSAKTTAAAGLHWAHNQGLPLGTANDHIWWSLSVTMGF